MKFSPLQGIILATSILAVVGGVLQEVSVYVKTADLSFMGQFKQPFLSILDSSWIIVAVTWTYNIFLYLRANVTQVQDELKKYDSKKFIATLTWFAGTLGSIFALAPSDEIKAWGTFVVVILTIVIKELQNVFGNSVTVPQEPSEPKVAVTPP
jgi:hypothetical protein